MNDTLGAFGVVRNRDPTRGGVGDLPIPDGSPRGAMMSPWRARAACAGAAPALALVLAALVVAIDVVGVAVFSTQAPYVGFLELARAALPGLAFAGAAIAVTPRWARGGARSARRWAWRASRPPPRGSGAGLQQHSPAWVAVESLGVGLAPAVVVVALVHPDGRLVGRVRRAAVWLAVALRCARRGGHAPRRTTLPPGTGAGASTNPVAVLDLSGSSYLRLADALST